MQLPHQIEEKINKFPEQAQEFVRDPRFESAIAQAGLRNGVHIDEIHELTLTVFRVITGIIPQEETQNAFAHFGLDRKRTQKLVDDLNRNVFTPFTHAFTEFDNGEEHH